MKQQRHVSIYYHPDGGNEVSISIDGTDTNRRYKNVSDANFHRLTNILWMSQKVSSQFVHLRKYPSIWFWYGEEDPRTDEEKAWDTLTLEWNETYNSLG